MLTRDVLMANISTDIEWINCVIVACTTWLTVGEKREPCWVF